MITAPRPATRIDPWLLGATVALLGVGVVMVYSASAVEAAKHTGSTGAWLFRHLASVAIGLCLLAAALRVGTSVWPRLAYPMLALCLLLLIAVFIPGIGRRAGGAARWLEIGPLRLQPAEAAKLAVILYLSHSLAKKRDAGKIRTFSIGFLPHVLVTGLVVALVLAEPDCGTAVVIALLAALLLFVAGARVSYLLLAALCALPLCWRLVAGTEYRMRRVLAFLDPFANRHGSGYQVFESLLAFGAGGIDGQGLGESRQKLFFLPEAPTDFIFAIIGEELGFLGVSAVVALFALYAARGLRIALREARPFQRWVAFGITAWVGIQALTHMAVVLGMLPTKGLTLPLVSFGRSSLVMLLLATGILLRIGAESVAAPSSGGAAERP